MSEFGIYFGTYALGYILHKMQTKISTIIEINGAVVGLPNSTTLKYSSEFAIITLLYWGSEGQHRNHNGTMACKFLNCLRPVTMRYSILERSSTWRYCWNSLFTCYLSSSLVEISGILDMVFMKSRYNDKDWEDKMKNFILFISLCAIIMILYIKSADQ